MICNVKNCTERVRAGVVEYVDLMNTVDLAKVCTKNAEWYLVDGQCDVELLLKS